MLLLIILLVLGILYVALGVSFVVLLKVTGWKSDTYIDDDLSLFIVAWPIVSIIMSLESIFAVLLPNIALCIADWINLKLKGSK